jgi:hypothetical protein
MNIWKLWDHFGISGSEFIGYWDAENPVKTNNENILASVYLKENSMMVAIGNWSDEVQKISLSVDWKKLGMNPSSAIVEVPEIVDLQDAAIADLNNLTIPASKGLILIFNK